MTNKTYNPGTAREDATTYAYDNANRLTADSKGNSYTYDEAGDLTGIGGGSRAQTTYSYNALGQITTATVGGTSVNYAYDPLGRMTARTQGNQTEYHTMRLTGDEPLKTTASCNSQDYAYTPGGTMALGMKDAEGSIQSFGLDLHTDVAFTLNAAGSITSSALYRPRQADKLLRTAASRL